jgi:copper chaperone
MSKLMITGPQREHHKTQLVRSLDLPVIGAFTCTAPVTLMETTSVRVHSMEMHMLELRVEGLTSWHCVKAVTEAVHSVAPQLVVAGDLQRGLLKITASNTTIPTNAVIKAIEEEGYKIN